MLIFIITAFMLAIPTLYIIQEKYIQKLAWMISLSQLALLAFTGKLDYLLSDWCVNLFNNVVSLSYTIIINKIVCAFIA